MKQKKLKLVVLLAVILGVNSIPVVSYADEKDAKKDVKIEIVQESKVLIEDNWLTREVATQLNKSLKDLKEEDFLSIKKIDLSNKKIDDTIPGSISLLKNLEYLDLNSSKIDGEIPNVLAQLTKIKYLNLSNNNITKVSETVEKKIINGNYYYCNLDGNDFKYKEGWHYLNSKWFYINSKGDKLVGNQIIDGNQYNFKKDGIERIGWYKQDDKWYYSEQGTGIVKSKWKNIDNKWYYFNEEGTMQKGIKNINSVNYYLNNGGEMSTGWKNIDNKWYYFSDSGEMKYGWMKYNNEWYYLDRSTGIMVSGEEKMIDGKNYKFYGEGILAENTWADDYKYSQANGECVNTYSNYSHSNSNYNMFKYMTNVDNQVSVHNTAISLHGNVESNNCVYFASEVLRRNGFAIPTSTANVGQLEGQLKNRGFIESYDLNQLKPGDFVFTNNNSHVYMFMCWDKGDYAYIIDNQKKKFDNNILHERNVLSYDSNYDTDPSNRFYYYPY
ncbi:cell wall-binding protein [Clostridium uliginosum]|uniref:Putative cell wall binding repeat-containing protein n=1 Tax=Clostridium uliginosum TaxID=119641 RepID=A0A1I1NXC2_9CLOT|nr:cell wall-binding protein [Clostridium uliginosum]SFD00138.1 Putative cell wall binding repeat-containing protein [Clostridium uliginosum]